MLLFIYQTKYSLLSKSIVLYMNSFTSAEQTVILGYIRLDKATDSLVIHQLHHGSL